MSAIQCNPECVRVCSKCGCDKPVIEFWGKSVWCKECHRDRYSAKSGYKSPSELRAKTDGFVRGEARLAVPLICSTCGFVGPRRNWPKRSTHYRGLCPQCDRAIQEQRPNGRKSETEESNRACPSCRVRFGLNEFLRRNGELRAYCRVCHNRKKQESKYRSAAKKGTAIISRAEQSVRAAVAREERLARAVKGKAMRHMYGQFVRLWESSEEYLSSRAEAFKQKYWAAPEHYRHQKRIYKAANPEKDATHRGKRGRRILETADGSLLPTTLSRMFDSAEHCAYCAKPMPSVADKSLDHFVPLALGGRHSVANVIICCRACNMSKNVTHPFIWLGGDEFERLVEKLRRRGAGDPAVEGKLYPETQVAA